MSGSCRWEDLLTKIVGPSEDCGLSSLEAIAAAVSAVSRSYHRPGASGRAARQWGNDGTDLANVLSDGYLNPKGRQGSASTVVRLGLPQATVRAFSPAS